MWFNEDEEEEGEAVVPPVEKSKSEDDFPDSYEKFMETKKGILPKSELFAANRHQYNTVAPINLIPKIVKLF